MAVGVWGSLAGEGFVEIEQGETNCAECGVFVDIGGWPCGSGADRDRFGGGVGVLTEKRLLAGEHFSEGVEFVGGGVSSDDATEGEGEAGVVLLGCGDALGGEHACGFVPGGIVEGGECVKGSVGAIGAHFAGLA